MLSELFENIKVYGRYVRSNSLNGLDGWANIKQFLSNPGNSIAVQQINTILGTEWNLSVQIETSNISDLDQIYEHVHGSNDGQLHMYGEENDDVSKSLDPDTWSKCFNIKSEKDIQDILINSTYLRTAAVFKSSVAVAFGTNTA